MASSLRKRRGAASFEFIEAFQRGFGQKARLPQPDPPPQYLRDPRGKDCDNFIALGEAGQFAIRLYERTGLSLQQSRQSFIRSIEVCRRAAIR